MAPSSKGKAVSSSNSSSILFSYCVGSTGFDPAERLRSDDALKKAQEFLDKDDFAGAIASYFQLPLQDSYVYHALGSVQLAEVQHVVKLGNKNGLHDWYYDADGKPLLPPPPADITAYTSLFHPTTSTASALTSLASNARKHSLRASVAAHLSATRYIHPALLTTLTLPRTKALPPSANPYLAFWTWSNHALSWTGPAAPESAPPRAPPGRAHHLLPVLMHHFGCAVPTHDALATLTTLAAGRPLADVGSGTGYWTALLRGPPYNLTMHAIDSAQSTWRTSWLPQPPSPLATQPTTGAAFLHTPAHARGRDMVLLLVYPVTGADGRGAFTRDLLRAYAGDTLAVVGCQDGSGYTGFRDETVAAYMARCEPAWTRVCQIALPSFAAKDEALFVFMRGERARRLLGDGGEEGEGGEGA